MYEFFTDDFAGLSAVMWNWIAMGVCILFVLLVVIALIKFLRGPKLGGRRGRNSRLAVTDATAIGDDRRKLVLVRRDNVEHLLLIGGPSDLVIETNIVKAAAPSQVATPPAKQIADVSRKDPALFSSKPAKPAAVAEAKPAPIAEPTKPVVSPEPVPQPAVAASPAVAPQVTAPAPAVQPSVQPSTAASSVAAAAAVVAAPIVAAATGDTITAPAVNTEDDSLSIGATETAEPESADAKRDPVEEMDALLKEISTDK